MLKKFILGTVFLLVGFENLTACMFGPPYMSVCEAYSKADFVVVGKVEMLEYAENSTQKVKIIVEKTFKGTEKKEIIFTQDYSNCFWDFLKDEGKNILLYLTYDTKADNYSFLLGVGGQVEKQSENLSWLNNLPSSLKRTRISGVIEHFEVSGNSFAFQDFVRGMKLKIVGENKTYEVFSDKNGVYEIWDVPKGKYSIIPEYPSRFKLRFPLQKGLIDFAEIGDAFKVKINKNGCGGSDYILNKTNNE